MKLNIDDDRAAKIVIKSLKDDYKFVTDDVYNRPGLKEAIVTMLRYYMTHHEVEKWLAKQEAKK